MRPMRSTLNGTWELSYGRSLPGGPSDPSELAGRGWPTVIAEVPGNVELDLIQAGILPELSVGNRIYELLPYERYEWWYRRSFTAPLAGPGEQVHLVFEGIDCLATVWVNGVRVGTTDNMLIPHRFDVTGLVRPGSDNEIAVRLAPAVAAGDQGGLDPVCFAFPGNHASLTVRKAPHMYGWDIMPRVVTAGLWREVALELVPAVHWRSVYWGVRATDPDRRTATVHLIWDFAVQPGAAFPRQVRAAIRRQGALLHEASWPVLDAHGSAQLSLTDVDLWWPLGFDGPGPAALYDAELELVGRDGEALEVQTTRLGLRTVHLERTEVTTATEPGEFVFRINGERVFCHGTNWVPLDAFHSRDPQHLDAALEMAVELNCNMLRCWGGNVYEDHPFFDRCDQQGIMVWQDFAMACAIYPQDDDFARRIRLEAEAVVGQLRNHPSLVLWSGNNEIDDAYHWHAGLDPNTDRLSRQVLPEVVRRLDPFRPYLPSSPYHSPEYLRRRDRGAQMPEQHLWGPRGDFKAPFYTQSACHFVSEIGYHGCPDRRSLEQFLDPDSVWPWQGNDQWLTHAVRPQPEIAFYNYRIGLMARQITVLFGTIPEALDDFVLASQITQAEAKKFFVEWFRQGKWQRTGILWWNLRDGWPIISDAVVDYYNRRKLAYEYLRRVQADLCLICGEPVDGRHPVDAVNDTRRPASGRLSLRDADSGKALFEAEFRVAANGRQTVGFVPSASQPSLWLIDWTVEGGATGRNHYLAGPRPFDLGDYRRWLGLLGIPPEVGPVR